MLSSLLHRTEFSSVDNFDAEETEMPGPIAPLKRKSYTRSSEKTRHANLFDQFAAIQGCPTIENFTLETINRKDKNGVLELINILECYASFVLEQRQKVKGKMEMYKCEGYDKMFATPKTVIAEKFKGEEWLQKDNPKNSWWAELYSDFKIRNRVQCLENGAPLEESTEGITRKQFTLICDGVMRGVHNKSGVAEAQDIELLAAMAVTRAAVGRSGESGLITVDNSMSWSEQWDIDWGEMKKGASTKIGMYPDAKEFLICPYFATAALVIAFPRLHDTNPLAGEPKWLFPKIASYVNGGAAGKITKVIHDVCSALGYIDGLHEKLVGHGLRAGAADDILLSVNSLDNVGVLLGAIFRGGWEFVSECVLLRYLFKKKYIALAGKILAGYDVPEQDVAIPALRSILESPDGEEYESKVDNLALLVFAGAEWSNKLVAVRDSLLATAFLHNKAVVERFGKTHIVAANFICFCSQVGISEQKIVQWGDLIRSDMEAKNKENRMLALRRKGDSSHRNSLLEEQNRLLREEMELMRAEQRAQVEEIKQLMAAQQSRDEERDRQLAQNQEMFQQIMAQLVKPRDNVVSQQPMPAQQPLVPPNGVSGPLVPSVSAQGPAREHAIEKEPAPTLVPAGVTTKRPTTDTPTLAVAAAAAGKRKTAPANSLTDLMKRAKVDASMVPQQMNQQRLNGMKATALLELIRREQINLRSTDPFGNPTIERSANSRARVLHRTAIGWALESQNKELIAAARYMQSNIPINKTDDAAFREALETLPAMSSLLVNHMNQKLIAEYEECTLLKSKVAEAPAEKRDAVKAKLIDAVKHRLQKGTLAKVSGVYEESNSKWKKPEQPKKKKASRSNK